MDLKKNFKQAVQELAKGSKAPKPGELEGAAETPGSLADEMPEVPVSDPITESEPVKEGSSWIKPPSADPAPRLIPPTVISENDIVEGDLKCAGDSEIRGTVNGNINGKGNIKFYGRQEGNTSGNHIDMFCGQIKGNVSAAGNMDIDSGSVIIGNLSAQTLTLDGRVKGDLDVKQALILRKNAVVIGKISASSISIEDGAAVMGEVKVCSVDLSSLSEMIKID